MIKTLFASMLLLLLTGCIAPTYAGEVVDNPFTFHQPLPKTANKFLEEAKDMYKKGDKNVQLFIDKMQAGWDAQQKQEGRTEPSDDFLACMLYQIHGPKSLDSVQLATSAVILAGGPKPDGSGNYEEGDARALVNGWNEQQYEIGYKLWKALDYYAASCYRYVHGGFIAMPSPQAQNTEYVGTGSALDYYLDHRMQ